MRTIDLKSPFNARPAGQVAPAARSALPLRRRSLLAAGALGWMASGHATDAWRPSRPIQILIAGTPGGVPDVLARRLAVTMQATLQQPVVIDYRAGASGRIAADAVLRAPHDGHTLTLCFLGPGGLLPAFNAATPDDNGAEGFESVGFLGDGGALVVTSTANPWKNLEDLANHLRANPSVVPSFGSPGAGTILRLYGEMLCDNLKRRGTHIGYKGVAPVLTDVASGQLTFSVVTVPAALPLMAGGRIRALASTSGVRVPSLAGVKTLSEQGYAEVDVTGWYAVWAGAGTPPAAIAELNRCVNQFVTGPEGASAFDATGLTGAGATTPAQVRARLTRDMKVWRKAVRSLNLTAEG